MSGRCFVVGAGLAGLSAALGLARAGRAVAVFEAAGRAGGRCRSFFDATLECEIDNGNHLVMAGNRKTLAFLDAVGARGRLAAVGAFPFLDLATGASWTVRVRRGLPPFPVFGGSRRIPGTGPLDYLRALRLARAGAEDTVAALLGAPESAYRRLWTPLATAVLNIHPEEGSALLLRSVFARTFLRGGCRPYVADRGLAHCFVDPAVAAIRTSGGEFLFNSRVRVLETRNDRIGRIVTTRETVPVDAGDSVVLAVPPSAASALFPELRVPAGDRAIVNAHYRLDGPPALPGGERILGLIGGTAQWIFARGHVASVTVSAADALASRPNSEIARILWTDVAAALDLDAGRLPPARIVNERRATFAQTPSGARSRPGTRTRLGNMFLAGDWTDTGLPATIEGAILSGRRAAAAVMRA